MLNPRSFAILYVLLWVFEGILRKSLGPLDAVLYVSRDALAVAYILLRPRTAFTRRATNGLAVLIIYLILVLTVGLLPAFHGSQEILVGLSGFNAMASPALGLYALGILCGFDDVRAALLLLVKVSPIVVVVSVLQVSSPPTAWINAVGSEGRAEFVNFDVVRATGTFTAPSGLTLFVVLLSAISIALISTGDNARWGSLGLFSSLLLVALGGSRGAVLGVSLVFIIALLKSTRSREAFRPVLMGAVLALLAFVFARIRFPGVLDSFQLRFEAAARSEDTSGRVLSRTYGFIDYYNSILGDGLGQFGNVARSYSGGLEWIEADSARWVAELGLLGLIFAIAKVSLGTHLLLRLSTSSRPHAISSLSVVVPTLLYGQMTQNPSVQGAIAIAGAWALQSFVKSGDSFAKHSEGVQQSKFDAKQIGA